MSIDALDPVGERVEGADRVVRVDAEVEREVVARARRNAHEREVVRVCRRGHDRERSVAAGHAEGIRAARDGLIDESRQSLIGARTVTSIPRSRARSARAVRTAVPSPDFGLTNKLGRSGGSAGRQPSRTDCCTDR